MAQIQQESASETDSSESINSQRGFFFIRTISTTKKQRRRKQKKAKEIKKAEQTPPEVLGTEGRPAGQEPEQPKEQPPEQRPSVEQRPPNPLPKEEKIQEPRKKCKKPRNPRRKNKESQNLHSKNLKLPITGRSLKRLKMSTEESPSTSEVSESEEEGEEGVQEFPSKHLYKILKDMDHDFRGCITDFTLQPQQISNLLAADTWSGGKFREGAEVARGDPEMIVAVATLQSGLFHMMKAMGRLASRPQDAARHLLTSLPPLLHGTSRKPEELASTSPTVPPTTTAWTEASLPRPERTLADTIREAGEAATIGGQEKAVLVVASATTTRKEARALKATRSRAEERIHGDGTRYQEGRKTKGASESAGRLSRTAGVLYRKISLKAGQS
jgi:hypothetical protein